MTWHTISVFFFGRFLTPSQTWHEKPWQCPWVARRQHWRLLLQSQTGNPPRPRSPSWGWGSEEEEVLLNQQLHRDRSNQLHRDRIRLRNPHDAQMIWIASSCMTVSQSKPETAPPTLDRFPSKVGTLSTPTLPMSKTTTSTIANTTSFSITNTSNIIIIMIDMSKHNHLNYHYHFERLEMFK